MVKNMALKMIDEHKNKLVDPIEMLYWTHLRVIINLIDNDAWEKAVEKAEPILRG